MNPAQRIGSARRGGIAQFRRLRVLSLFVIVGGFLAPGWSQRVVVRDATRTDPADPEKYPEYRKAPGPYAVSESEFDWMDVSRKRNVPVRIYQPQSNVPDLKFPLIVFSHGLGGSRDGYGYLGRHWASYGFVVIHPTHAGSDREIFRADGTRIAQTLVEAGQDPLNWANRPQDVSFVIDRAKNEVRLSRVIDFERIGVAGHSFGAHTALATVGLLIDFPRTKTTPSQPDRSFTDVRVKAAIAMSPSPSGRLGLDRTSWSRIAAPVLYMTGTRDEGLGVRDARDRLEAFRESRGADQFQIVIDKAAHLAFSDVEIPNFQRERRDPKHHDYIRMSTTAFWDAYLKQDAFAQQWLLDDILEGYSQRDCEVRHKNVTPVVAPFAPEAERKRR